MVLLLASARAVRLFMAGSRKATTLLEAEKARVEAQREAKGEAERARLRLRERMCWSARASATDPNGVLRRINGA